MDGACDVGRTVHVTVTRANSQYHDLTDGLVQCGL